MKSTQDTAQKLLDAGLFLLSQKGFTAVGLTKILETAQVPKGSFYHYFSSKEEFGQRIIEQYITNYKQQLSDLFATYPESGTRAMYEFWQAWSKQEQDGNGCLVVKLAAEVADLSENMRQALHQGCEEIIELVAHRLAQAQAAGEFKPEVDMNAFAQHLYFLWLGACTTYRLYRPVTSCLEATTQQTSWLLAQVTMNKE
ncbi:TetR/AcrR family transcriptional regulator [Psittacicella hinzii]|uniref:HTH tetR-type domain-containing protein n=1 Tax=Psittacicella hinzii TaxID=2028575 RepID=A0A3A1YX15_9GAMM|nr:TetR/AcrR family transcriptional regulator [Psittacicella hinzii]RIY40597.1 hypothetical protein CKF58_00305 [Psittacicella hinzii]